MEEKQRYHCIAVTKQDDHYIAVIGDAEVMGESTIKSLQRAAPQDRSKVVLREGVTTYGAEALAQRVAALQGSGMDRSVPELQRVLEILQRRDLELKAVVSGMSAPVLPPAMRHM